MLKRLYSGRICAVLMLTIYILAGLFILSTVTTHNQEERAQLDTEEIDGSSLARFLSPDYVFIHRPKRKLKLQWCQPLRFLSKKNRPVIALVSFPGSGNTWVRYLIQQATGIHTGSVYKDLGLLENGFPGEYVVDGSVVVVKTHEKSPAPHRMYNKAVLLVRDPMQAIQAEFNRQGGGHIGFASPDRYRIANGRYWESFVDRQADNWRETNLYWIKNFTNPTMILFYDDLVNNLEKNLRRLLKFIEIPVSESRIQCTLDRREGIYRRQKRMITVDPFTKDMKTKIEGIKSEVYKVINDFIQVQEKQDQLIHR